LTESNPLEMVSKSTQSL